MHLKELDLHSFHTDELNVLLSFIRREKGKPLSDELKFSIAKGQLFVKFEGDPVLEGNKYGLFYGRISEIEKGQHHPRRKFLMTVKIITQSLSSSHIQIFKKGGVDWIMVAGSTKQHAIEFDGYSNNWKKLIDLRTLERNPYYEFGKKMNELLFK